MPGLDWKRQEPGEEGGQERRDCSGTGILGIVIKFSSRPE